MTTGTPDSAFEALQPTAAERSEVDRQLVVLRRGAVDLLPENGFRARLLEALRAGRPLRVKAGFDPTAPDLHLGHAVLLTKLRQLQDLGHQVIFLIGDFTARIGDPTGRNETRPPLAPEQIRANAETYAAQVFRILDESRTELRYNSEWMEGLGSADWLRLASVMTVARMLEREDFAQRYAEQRPIRVHEFLYPLVQGYDSVALASDLELGGTDQTFNLLVGRDVQRFYGRPEQAVLTLPLLEGLDGVQKMSKSYGNAVGILEAPGEQFGKLMSISDELMWRYYELLSLEDPAAVRGAVDAGTLHPMEAKKRLAVELVTRFHGAEAAASARAGFEAVFAAGAAPDEMPELHCSLADGPIWLPRVLAEQKLVASVAEGRRLLGQGGIRVDDARLAEPGELTVPGSYVVKAGKRRFLRLIVEA